jgi:MFS family permease
MERTPSYLPVPTSLAAAEVTHHDAIAVSLAAPDGIAVSLPAPEVAADDGITTSPLIRRNVWLLTIAEAFVGTAQQMVPTLSSIIIGSLLGDATFAGAGSSITGLCRVIVSYPSGALADRWGRKPVLLLGLLISLLGALAVGIVVPIGSVVLFFAALTVFAIGSAGSQQQRRLSAADLFPPARRAQGLGFVLTGSIVGALFGPVLISIAQAISDRSGWDPLALPFWLVPLLILPSFVLIWRIRPDPRDIALHLEDFYPGYRPPVSSGTLERTTADLRTLLRSYPQVVALVSMFVLYGNMSMLMSMTPLSMTHEGMSLPAISVTVALHVVGMYGLSAPLGHFADRFGRRSALILGLTLSTFGTLLAALSTDYVPIVLGLFLIGVGWCCGNVATPAIIADTSPPEVRGRAMGLNLSLSAIASVTTPLLGGFLLERFGPAELVIVSVAVLCPCLAVVLRLRETSPGHYAHAASF